MGGWLHGIADLASSRTTWLAMDWENTQRAIMIAGVSVLTIMIAIKPRKQSQRLANGPTAANRLPKNQLLPILVLVLQLILNVQLLHAICPTPQMVLVQNLQRNKVQCDAVSPFTCHFHCCNLLLPPKNLSMETHSSDPPPTTSLSSWATGNFFSSPQAFCFSLAVSLNSRLVWNFCTAASTETCNQDEDFVEASHAECGESWDVLHMSHLIS